MFKGRNYNAGILIVLAVLAAACDKAQLLAPTKSTITLSAATRVLPSNGTTPITAAVLEQAGTPVQNGTTVRFTTTLGHVDPVEVETVNADQGSLSSTTAVTDSSGEARTALTTSQQTVVTATAGTKTSSNLTI